MRSIAAYAIACIISQELEYVLENSVVCNIPIPNREKETNQTSMVDDQRLKSTSLYVENFTYSKLSHENTWRAALSTRSFGRFARLLICSRGKSLARELISPTYFLFPGGNAGERSRSTISVGNLGEQKVSWDRYVAATSMYTCVRRQKRGRTA